MDRKPRLLFFTYAFPPLRAIGAVRCWYLAKHLAQHEWDVEVVTLNPALLRDPEPGIDVVTNSRQAHIRLRLTGHNWRAVRGQSLKLRWWEPNVVGGLFRRMSGRFWIDNSFGWVKCAIKACASLQPGDVDLVLVSGPPFGAFRAAQEVASRLRTPLVLDYRDLWTLSPQASTQPPARVVQRERSILASSAGVVVVSEPMGVCMRDKFQPRAPLKVVTNGYDPEDCRGLKPVPFDSFSVVYAGTFWPPMSTVDPLISAVARSNRSEQHGRRIVLHYYGRQSSYVAGVAAALEAQSWVQVHGQVPRRKVLEALAGADVAAIITNVHAQASATENTILTGKLFEAIGTGARLLVIAPQESEINRLIRNYALGACFCGSAIEDIARWLITVRDGPTGERPKPVTTFGWPAIVSTLDSFLRLSLAGGTSIS